MSRDYVSTRERIREIVRSQWPTDSREVDRWHPDDVALYRCWPTFDGDARADALLVQRQNRVADAVCAEVEQLNAPSSAIVAPTNDLSAKRMCGRCGHTLGYHAPPELGQRPRCRSFNCECESYR